MVQPRQLNLPTQRDPLARLALFALIGVACWIALSVPSTPVAAETVLIATPTIGIVPTTAPTEAPVPTAEPQMAQAAPTFAPPPTLEPQIIIERQVIIQEVTAPPVPTEPPPPAPTEPLMLAAPSGSIIVIATAGSRQMSDQEFVASFGAPTTSACGAFIGCLPKP